MLSAIDDFKPINLDELNKVALMKRFDRKFVFHKALLNPLLEDLANYYDVLELEGKRIFQYKNIYFDTADLKCYHDHQRGKANRYKFRKRLYSESGVSFCELKFKDNKKRVDKSRVLATSFKDSLSQDEKQFIHENSDWEAKNLKAVVEIDFKRISLRHKGYQNRCTLDIDLKAKLDYKTYAFDDLVIAEIKQEGQGIENDFSNCLRKLGIREAGFSKYCYALLKTRNSLKYNRFKKGLINLDKIANGTV